VRFKKAAAGNVCMTSPMALSLTIRIRIEREGIITR
jgi:hypothetical protein